MIGDGAGKRPWVYTATVKGSFHKLHRYSGAILIPLYLIAPWIAVGGHRLILLDLGHRRFHLFGATFTAMDTRFLLVLLLVLGFAFFFFTAILGRVWCGYACPQTVFLEEWVRRVEGWIEGNRGARRRLDEAPWTLSKVAKKTSKWLIFLIMSVVLGLTFVGYFTDTPDLWTFRSSTAAYGVAAFFTASLFFDFVWFREQFCNYLCPYARFQGALTDDHTLTIGYDARRGEPRQLRGKRERGAESAFGDCVSCNLCVAVCPQGIDIRDGYQLECTTCGHCIDACESVLPKHGVKGLISYTTEARLQGAPKRAGRARPIVYGLAVLAAIGTLVGMLVLRSSIDVTVTRAPGELFRVLDDGSTENAFRAHLLNNDSQPRDFSLSLAGLEGASLVVPFDHITIPAGQDQVVPVFVLAGPRAVSGRSASFELVVRSGDDEIRMPETFQSGAQEL